MQVDNVSCTQGTIELPRSEICPFLVVQMRMLTKQIEELTDATNEVMKIALELMNSRGNETESAD
eukprot:scaffold181990_cov18-Prasinocladus_malaysianus.AAC.2